MKDLDLFSAYIPPDRRLALSQNRDLPNRVAGAALFADISGFSSLTETLSQKLGARQGAEELTKLLNAVYGALIVELDQYRGNVIGFSGDAITCWLDGDDGTRAISCALAMQRIMTEFTPPQSSAGIPVPLSIKVGISAGPARRFRVGNPALQYIDALAGSTIDRMATAEKLAQKGEIVVTAEIADHLADTLEVSDWRMDEKTKWRFAVINNLTTLVAPLPWPESNATVLSEAQARPWLLPPVYERLRTGLGQFLAEIRPAAALFLHFGELDYDQDETAGDKLDNYVCWAQQVLANYGGYLLQLTFGDKEGYFYAGFGAPLFHEDYPIRAIAAAIDLLSPPPNLDFITRSQIGLSRGPMWTGAYGGATRHTYGVLGNEVNVAARLMEQAGHGQILASQHLVKTLSGRYTFQYQGMLKVKGQEKPIPVSQVLGRAAISPQRPLTLFRHPLIGRKTELNQMQQALATVQSGQQGFIIRVEGEAGLGKSHLAADFAERALQQGFRLAVGVSQSTSQEIAYYPWRHILQNLLGLSVAPPSSTDLAVWPHQQAVQVETILVETNPTWQLRVPLLGDLLPLPIPDNDTTRMFDPKSRREALFALVIEILQIWTIQQPLLLLFEDAHWLDEASRQLLLALGQVIADMPVLLVLVHRPSPGPLLSDLNQSQNYLSLPVGELTEAEIGSLAVQRLSGHLSPLALALVQAHAQGNPFFAEEMIDALHEQGKLTQQATGDWELSEKILAALRQANCLIRQPDGWDLAPDAPLETAKLELPETVQGIILSRIDCLPETYRLTLKAASVIGRTFEVELLTQIHPESLLTATILDQLRQLEQRDLVHLETPPPYPTYMFRHNITHEAVNQLLTEELRCSLHQQVGLTLEWWQPNAVERLAYHFARSDVNQSEIRDKALLYLGQAAYKTQREYANETALNYYDQALALEERWAWRQGKIEVLHILSRRDEERDNLTKLKDIPTASAWQPAFLWGQYYEAIGEYDQAQAVIELAIKICRDANNVAGEVRCLSLLGLVARRRGAYDEAQKWYNQAMQLLQQQEIGAEKIQILNGLGTVYRQQDRYDQARACYQQALALSRASNNRLDEGQSLNNLGLVARYQLDFVKAELYHRQALEIRRHIGDRAGEGISLFDLAVTFLEMGDYDQAKTYFETALTVHQTTNNRWEEVNVYISMGNLHLLLGELPTAQARLEQGRKLSQEIGDKVGEAYLLCGLGQVARDQGEWVTAEKLLLDSLTLAQEQAEKHLIPFSLSHLGLLHLQAGRPGRAIEWASQALSLRQASNLRLSTLTDLSTLAEAYLVAGDVDQALIYEQQIITLLNECGGKGPEFPHRDYFVCYKVLMSAGQAEAAHAVLQSAYNLVMAQAKSITVLALRRSFEGVRFSREIIEEYNKIMSEV